VSQRFARCLREWAEVFGHRSMRDFVRFAKQAGISMPQMHTLMRLYHEGACGVSDVGAQLGVTNAAASQMIERLVQQGLVERTEDVHDRRVKHLSLTARGRALVQKGIEARRRWMDDLPKMLSAERQAAIVAALDYLTQAARRLEKETPGE